jgi:CarboxypepD_reg-like domain
MRTKNYEEWQTFRAISAYLEAESDIVNGSVVLKEDAGIFNDLLADLEAKIEDKKSNSTLNSTARNQLKQAVAETTRELLFKLKAHGIKNKDTELVQFCKPSLTTMTNMSENEFVDFTRQTVIQVNALAEVLTKYGVSADDRTAFTQNVEKFANIGLQIRVQNSKASVNSENLNELFKEIKKFTNEVLTVAVNSVTDNPDFIKAFNDVKVGNPPSVTPTQVTVKIKDVNNGEAVKNVQISVPELKVTGFTDENGKFTVKTGSKRDITMAVSKTDWKSQEITITKLIKGRVREVEVLLERILVEV